MKLTINEAIAVELDSTNLQRAALEVTRIAASPYGAETLDALFTVLLFRQLEKAKPGTVDRLMSACSTSKAEGK